MPSCTICGVSFGTRAQVRGHIQGSTGEHAGIGYADADEYIRDTPVDDDDDAGDGDPPGGAASTPASSPSSTTGLAVPQRQVIPQASTQKDEPTCPECGSNRYFDASEHTDYPYGCADCSDNETWMVYGNGVGSA